jgi:hypothetical protein
MREQDSERLRERFEAAENQEFVFKLRAKCEIYLGTPRVSFQVFEMRRVQYSEESTAILKILDSLE